MKFPFKISTKKKEDCSKLLLSTFSFIANSSSDGKSQEVSLDIDGMPKTFTVRIVK